MRCTLLFLVGLATALGVTHTARAIASCFQPIETAPLELVEMTLDGETTEVPFHYDDLGFELAAAWDGVEITVRDRQGYITGGERFQRGVR
jgi:hypothetical protein